jgi:hypothetical protein
MSLTNKQYQSLQSEACDLAANLPRSGFLDSLIALYEAGRLLHLTRPTLIGLLGSVALRRLLDEIDEEAPLAPPAPGLWPRVLDAAGYDHAGNLILGGTDDSARLYCETLGGCHQEAWLLKQLYLERKHGRRRQVKRRK